jgi:hypothetical protein
MATHASARLLVTAVKRIDLCIAHAAVPSSPLPGAWKAMTIH